MFVNTEFYQHSVSSNSLPLIGHRLGARTKWLDYITGSLCASSAVRLKLANGLCALVVHVGVSRGDVYNPAAWLLFTTKR